MVAKTSFPPIHHHPRLTKPLKPADAQKQLAAFLAQTSTKAYLHPDAILSASGIQYSAQSGPNGGLAIHHLRRMEAGLRGENLIAESAEELAEQFGALPDGDDTRVDALIDSKINGSKRKRSMDEVGQWAEDASEAAYGDVSIARATEDWEDKEQYELKQRPVEGEVGDRDGAGVARQDGEVPVVVEEKKVLSEADKKARKAAKKEKNKARKAGAQVDGMGAQGQGSDVEAHDDEPKQKKRRVEQSSMCKSAAGRPGTVGETAVRKHQTTEMSKTQQKRQKRAKRKADKLRQAGEVLFKTAGAAGVTNNKPSPTSQDPAKVSPKAEQQSTQKDVNDLAKHDSPTEDRNPTAPSLPQQEPTATQNSSSKTKKRKRATSPHQPADAAPSTRLEPGDNTPNPPKKRQKKPAPGPSQSAQQQTQKPESPRCQTPTLAHQTQKQLQAWR
ncbi:hypothetical protein Tdes44962_MAKER06704 [Teratosphaeria destructans]|uniref:Uncharacterized protein n=1 Tax=Teratosphaeria destructans TaxID=418781 RepID=A0A9W7T146_9PEZI|nr:hypothetical protein Tdes44962_MAKER06704 [Teratosphaeria destructans]